MPNDDRVKPKTRPTGVPPPGAARSAAKPRTGPSDADRVRARLVKRAYTLARRNWESTRTGLPSAYSPGKKYDGKAGYRIENTPVEAGKGSAWLDLADWCDARRINPEAYIHEAFLSVPLGAIRPPDPYQLKSSLYLAAWDVNESKMLERVTLALRSEREIAHSEVVLQQKVYGADYDESCLCAATDSSLALSPLFRYCFAISVGTKKLTATAGKFESRAVMQFEQRRALYLKAWADVLPEGFADFAKQVYPRLLAQFGLEQEAIADVEDDDEE